MFQVPAKTQYAIRALVHLARNGSDSAARIAEAQKISPKYLEGILNQLKLSGLVASDRGRSGGYRLAKDSESIAMIEVVRATEGEIRPVECVDRANLCALGDLCMPRKFWIGLKDAVNSYLSSVSLADLAEDSAFAFHANPSDEGE
ncbi:MAG: BadM/Rrf2 family transcriptional regulator [Spirochaetes bacterium]|nr:MAG: BadM/Rrf2 family transcriptional regulator [Spirochaetota bacterium]